MIYTVRLPDQQKPAQMELAELKAAYANGSIPGKALVTLEHQDFWYSVAELMGDKPPKPLLFPCPPCKQMIRARAIDRGNPVTCPKCQARVIVTNPAANQAAATAATEKHRGHPTFWLGLITFLIGLGMVVYPYLRPAPGVAHGLISYVITIVGIAMMSGSKLGRVRRLPRG